MSTLISTGNIVDNEEVTIAASVYEETTTEESGSGQEAGSHYVTLSCKRYNADEMPAKPWGYEDVLGEASAGALVVPGFDGHEDVTLEEPTAIKYSKTKAFVRDDKAQIYVALRYNY